MPPDWRKNDSKRSRLTSTNVLQPTTSSGVDVLSDNSLRITEIFFSLQGETRTVGLPTVFIRLTGCPLRCQYCDTSYAFSGGERWSIASILAAVARYPAHYVTVTGGEPMAQPACPALIASLADAGYAVSIETSGAFPVDALDSRVVRVFDLKTPDSGEASRNRMDQLAFLTMRDQVKFVIMSEDDYNWAVAICRDYNLSAQCEVLFSAAEGWLAPTLLADWILRDGLAVRFQVQLHKILWGNEKGR